jgi:hypothetical protein
MTVLSGAGNGEASDAFIPRHPRKGFGGTAIGIS